MAKHCEHCKLPYPDDLEACPRCGPQPAAHEEEIEVHPEVDLSSDEAILVDEDTETEADAILLDEHPEEPAAHGEVVDLADVHVLSQHPPSDVALGHEVPAGEGASDVALVHEAPGEGASDVALGRQGPAGEDASDVALVHEAPPEGSDITHHHAPPPDGSDVSLAPESGSHHGPSSDVVLLGADEVQARGADSAIHVSPRTGDARGAKAPKPPAVPPPQVAPDSTADISWSSLVEDKPPAQPASDHKLVVDAPSDADILAAADADEAVPTMDLSEEAAEVVPESETDIDLGEHRRPGAGAAAGASAVDLGGLQEGPASPSSDLNLVPEAMEPGPSDAYLGRRGRDAVEQGSGVDLMGTPEPVQEGSGIDLMGTMAPGDVSGSGSELNLGAPAHGSSVELGGPQAKGTTGSDSELNLGKPKPQTGSDSDVNVGPPKVSTHTEFEVNLPQHQGTGEVGDLEETLTYEGAQPPARDIVEEVESGVNLDKAAEDEAADALREDALNRTAGDSAIDLGATELPAEEEPVSRVGSRGSGLGLSATQEEPETPAAEVEEQPEEVEEEPSARPGRPPRGAEPGRRAGVLPWVGGWAIGAVMGAAALWVVGLVSPSRTPQTGAPPQQPPQQQPQQQAVVPAAEPTLENAHTRLAGGDYQEALKMYAALGQSKPDDPAILAARGEAKWLSALEQLSAGKKEMTKEELEKIPEVKEAREDLTKASATNPDALFWLGEIQEMTDGPAAARQTFQKGLQQFPQQRRRFQAALDSLETREEAAAGGAGAWLRPTGSEAYWRALALIALQAPGAAGQQPPAGEPAEPAGDEPGYHFWEAMRLAQEHHYADALKALETAQQLHRSHRFTRKVQNPNSDPTQEIFLRATDQLRAYWQVRDKLEQAGLLDPNKGAGRAAVLNAVNEAADEHKVVKELKDKLKSADLAKSVDELVQKAETANAGGQAGAKLVAALKEAGVKADDPVQGVKELDQMRTKDKKKLDEVTEALRAADVKADDPARGVEELARAKKADQKKLDDLAAAVKAAGGKGDDPVQAVKDLVAAREELTRALDGVRKELVARKYLPESSKPADVPEAARRMLKDVDHPVVVALSGLASELGGLGGKVGREMTQALGTQGQLVAARMELARLQAQVGDRPSPEQMMDLYVVLLRNGAERGLTDRALRDAQAVLNQKPMPAAVCVKGLAERDQGKYDAARKDLRSIVGAPGEPDAAWRQVVRTTLAELTDPAAHYVPHVRRLGREGRWGEALAAADQALEAFPEKEFPKEHASLLALRSLVRQEMARAQGGPELPPEMVAQAQQDADAALAGGETIEGNYALGRLAEARGDLARAEAGYRAAVKAFDTANAADLRKDHPAADPTGNRYREALTRALLEVVRRARPQPAAPAAPPAEGTKTGRAGSAKSTTVAASTTTTVSTSTACVLPVVTLQTPAEGEAPPADARLQEALELADKLIASGDARGLLLKGEVLGRMGRWNDARKTIDLGVRRSLPPAEAGPVEYILEYHPAFQRRPGLNPPDPLLAEEHYAAGLREYFNGNLVQAEKDFADAAYYNDQDARYWYFLGLARLPQPGKRDLALDDFRQGGRLEADGRPPSAAVSIALQRVQGPGRHLLNRVRQDAIQELTSKQP